MTDYEAMRVEADEVWMPISISAGKYEASNFGNIRHAKFKRLLKPAKFRGYQKVSINISGKFISKFVHRLVLDAFYGESDMIIDHINKVKNDNRLINLRYVSTRENNTKERIEKNPFIGAHFHKATGKWTAAITDKRKQKHLGYFDTQKEAHDAYIKARKEFGDYR